MIDNFTDWVANNEKVVAAGGAFMKRLNSEQNRILGEIYPIKSSTIGIDPDVALLAFRQYIASGKKDFSALVELVKPIVEWPMKNLLVDAALSLMEIRIEPTYYVGQDYSNDIGVMYKKFVTNVSKTHTKFLKEKHNDN